MKTLCLLCLAAFTAACTPHVVRCDGRLEPINTTTSVPSTPTHAAADVRAGAR